MPNHRHLLRMPIHFHFDYIPSFKNPLKSCPMMIHMKLVKFLSSSSLLHMILIRILCDCRFLLFLLQNSKIHMELQGRRNVCSFWGIHKRTPFIRVEHQSINNFGGLVIKEPHLIGLGFKI